MEIQPSNSVGQATALFTGWTQEEVQNEIARIYPYPTINTLLFSKNTQEAITSTGSHKDFNEKNLIEGHRMLQGFITNPFQSVQDIPQSKADPFYYDAGLSEIQDLQQNTIGHPTGIPEVQDPRTAFISNQLKARIFRGQVDNELSKDYLNNLWLSQVDKGATYYQAQAIKQNEALNKHTADKLNAIQPIGSDTYIRNVNMGTINEKPHKDIKRNVVVRATPIHTASSRHAKLNRLHNRFYSGLAQLDEAEKQTAGHVGNTQATHPLLELQSVSTHNRSHLGVFDHPYDGTSGLSGHSQHGDRGGSDESSVGSSITSGTTATGSTTIVKRKHEEFDDSHMERIQKYENEISALNDHIGEQKTLYKKTVTEDEQFIQEARNIFKRQKDAHLGIVDNIIAPLYGQDSPGLLNTAFWESDSVTSGNSYHTTKSSIVSSGNSYHTTESIEDGIESKKPDPSNFITPTSSPNRYEGNFNTATKSFKYYYGSSTSGADTNQKSDTQQLQESMQQTFVGEAKSNLNLHFEAVYAKDDDHFPSIASDVYNHPAPTGDIFVSHAPMQGGNDAFDIPYDNPPPTRTSDARYGGDQKYTPEKEIKPVDLTDIVNLVNPVLPSLMKKKFHVRELTLEDQKDREFYTEKDNTGKEFRGGMKEYRRVRDSESKAHAKAKTRFEIQPRPKGSKFLTLLR